MKAKRGDIGFTQGTAALSQAIRWATRGPKEERTWANHTLGFVTSGYVVPMFDYAEDAAKCVEALAQVERNAWFHRHQKEDGTQIAVFRHRHATEEELARRVLFLEKHVGESYGWWKLLFHLADRAVFKDRKVFSRMLHVDNRPICSYLEAKSWSLIGVDFGMPAEAADPDEMMDWCEANPDIWEWVGTATIGG